MVWFGLFNTLTDEDPKILEISRQAVEIVPKEQLIPDCDFEDIIQRINNSSIRDNSCKSQIIGRKIFKKKWPIPFLEALKIKVEV